MNKKDFITKIGEIVSKFDDVDIAYIFGSFLESEKFEDIDVGLVLNKDISPYARFKLSMKVARELERKIKPRLEFDVKILNHSPIEFQHEVLKKGRVVFSRNEDKRIEFESRLISTYLDHRVMYDFIDKAFLARV